MLKSDTSSRHFPEIVTRTTANASYAQTLNPSCAGTLHGQVRVFSHDNATLTCAYQVLGPFPRRLRLPSFANRTTSTFCLHGGPRRFPPFALVDDDQRRTPNSRQKGEVRKSATRHSCDHMRRRVHSLNPLACGRPTSLEPNIVLRQPCVRLHPTVSGSYRPDRPR